MSLNKVILIGNVGRDPEIRSFDANNRTASFTLATNERGFTRADGTQVAEHTDWHTIIVRRNDQVNFVERFVRKGSSVLVDGKIRYRDYEKDGIKRYVTEIIADKVEFYSTGRRDDSNNNNRTFPANPTTAQSQGSNIQNDTTPSQSNIAEDGQPPF